MKKTKNNPNRFKFITLAWHETNDSKVVIPINHSRQDSSGDPCFTTTTRMVLKYAYRSITDLCQVPISNESQLVICGNLHGKSRCKNLSMHTSQTICESRQSADDGLLAPGHEHRLSRVQRYKSAGSWRSSIHLGNSVSSKDFWKKPPGTADIYFQPGRPETYISDICRLARLLFVFQFGEAPLQFLKLSPLLV